MGINYSEIIDDLGNIVIKLRQGSDRDAYKEISNHMPVINTLFLDIIKNLNIFKENGIEVSESIIMMQLNNMLDGLQYRDDVKLADTLEYEIIDTINIYREITKQN